MAFFAQSRDQGKAKCRGAKARLKQRKRQVQRGAARRRRDHNRVRALGQEVERWQAENRRLTEAWAAGEKKAP